MSEVNCCIPGRSSSSFRGSNGQGLGTFRIWFENDNYSAAWWSKVLAIIAKLLVVDANMRKQIDSRTLYIYEKDYTGGCLTHCKYNLNPFLVILQ